MNEKKIKHTTLCLVLDQTKLLMIFKKRGQGAGKWNMPGGKLLPNEAAIQAAERETIEETGITPKNLQEKGILEFYFPESNSWDNICHIFSSSEFSGQIIPDSEECSAHWIEMSEIPFEKMWDDDKLWLPLVLAGKKIHRIYTFDAQDKMKEEKILDRLD